jgi:hypothetical protein
VIIEKTGTARKMRALGSTRRDQRDLHGEQHDPRRERGAVYVNVRWQRVRIDIVM